MKLLALPLAVLAFHGSMQPLRPPLRTQIAEHRWHRGCPVPLSRLRVVSVDYFGFDGRVRSGPLVVNQAVAGPVLRVFRGLYALHFRIRQIEPINDSGDQTSSFDCRDAVPSPCSGGSSTGHWSMHAYGEAIDLNPIENPYTGCGKTRERRSRPYLDSSRLRKGMATPAAVAAFRSIGWGWGGAWTGTKD